MKNFNIILNVIGIFVSALAFGFAVRHDQTLFIFIDGALIAFNTFLLTKNLERR